MHETELVNLLQAIQHVSVGILGDFCLDAYLSLDPSASEISLETGLPTQAVRRQHYSLGGAGNVANNLSAMGVRYIMTFGVVGNDPFGGEMIRMLNTLKLDSSGLLTQVSDWDTHVYVKPYQGDTEQNRIDFGNFNTLTQETCHLLLQQVEQALPHLDILIINQQVCQGIYTKEFRQQLRSIIRHHPETPFIADSRHYSDDMEGAMRKLNDHEGAMLCCGIVRAPEDPISFREAQSISQELYARWQQTLFLTRREHGCVVHDDTGSHNIHGLRISTPTDPVGAGDSMLAGIAASLASGATPAQAAGFGNLVAGVTVQKLFQTGTASPEEILKIGTDPEYRY
jgi:rfaE bifunctional protein kinase chain/domain